MKFFLKLCLVIAVVISPLTSFAEKVSADEMKSTCLNGFSKDADKASDPEAYKSYVNKMCDCSAAQVGGKEVDSSAVMVAMGSCMRLTLLTETMNNLKDDEDITADKIAASCMKEWAIFTSTKKDQGTLEKTCTCSAKKIMALDESKRTDEASLTQVLSGCTE